MAQRLPTDFTLTSYVQSGTISASIALPTPLDTRVTYLITRIAAEVEINAAPATNTGVDLTLKDGVPTTLFARSLVLLTPVASQDGFDVEGHWYATPGSGVTLAFTNNATSGLINQMLLISGTIL